MTTAGLTKTKAKPHRWTDAEREIVRRDWQGNRASCAQIAQKLGVTIYGVKGQAARMGIMKNKSPDWTPAEIEILESMIHRYPPLTIARRLHRSLNAVVIKSRRLHFSLRIRDGWYNKLEVCEILGVDHHWVQSRIDSGKLKASRRTDVKPSTLGSACWQILHKDLRDFIINNACALTGRNVDLFQIVSILTGPAEKETEL